MKFASDICYTTWAVSSVVIFDIVRSFLSCLFVIFVIEMCLFFSIVELDYWLYLVVEL
jgi:hypothetical protein